MAVSGYLMSEDCGIEASSLKSLHLIAIPDLEIAADQTTFDLNAKEWTAIIAKSGKVFKEYEFKPGEAEFKSTLAVENRVPKYVNDITFRAEKMSPKTLEMIDELAVHSYCGMAGVAEDFYGNRYFAGFDEKLRHKAPLEIKSGEVTTGRGLSGQQGGDISIGCETPKPPRPLANGVTIPVITPPAITP